MTQARSDRNQFASVNHGRPAVVATAKPGEFKSPGVVPAKASASDRVTTSPPKLNPNPSPAPKAPRDRTTSLGLNPNRKPHLERIEAKHDARTKTRSNA